MVLVPILKGSMSTSLDEGASSNSPRVKFDLPYEKNGLVTYFREDGSTSKASKLNFVLKTIYSKDTEESILITWIAEFKDNILFLDKQNEAIALALLKLEWYNKSDAFVRMYHELVLNLVTAHSFYLRFVLSMIISTFFKVSSDKEALTEEEMKSLKHVHSLVRHITQLIPLSQPAFFTMLAEKFPYMKSPPCVILHYVENLLIVANSCLSSKRYLILNCIIEKIIHIDVLCSKDIIEFSEFQKKEELMDEDVKEETSLEKAPEQMAFPLAHTLDILLNCLFTYIKETCFSEEDDQMNWETTKKLYRELLTEFEKVILPTQGSCHIQYLLFYVCSLKQEICDGFLDYLWKKVQNPSVAPVLRQIASFYIGSLLARANYINILTVTACLDLMCNWIHRYIEAHTSQDLDVHGTFHSVCQTVFYVFSFRNKELLEMKDGHKYLCNLNFDRMVTCRLNPLRYCDRNIVQNFASLARNHQIAYVYPVIEKNNRNLLYAGFQSNSEEPAAGAMIPTFFPFDPYLLKRSKQWIEPHYRLYNHSSKEEDVIDHNEEEEMIVNDEMFSYSMSPGFKKSYLLKSE